MFCTGSLRTNFIYNFVAFTEDNIRPGDRVMVDDPVYGQITGKVKSMWKTFDEPIRGEIICKLDYTNFEKRKETRKKLERLKNQMDNIVEQNQNSLYKAIAKENPEMEKLLRQYNEIAG